MDETTGKVQGGKGENGGCNRSLNEATEVLGPEILALEWKVKLESYLSHDAIEYPSIYN
ncbi:hypothetical protein EYZ11_010539 [Aspergillus tanneri]|uniref:Uncharacterized protein n=1 Tax=Aspergillus tanneri TaxID=1220188 RepID=A0A4S3J553_9EURO|nr:hypothetical protein EYZ11_010539 [Aspergillus tanneri]